MKTLSSHFNMEKGPGFFFKTNPVSPSGAMTLVCISVSSWSATPHPHREQEEFHKALRMPRPRAPDFLPGNQVQTVLQ